MTIHTSISRQVWPLSRHAESNWSSAAWQVDPDVMLRHVATSSVISRVIGFDSSLDVTCCPVTSRLYDNEGPRRWHYLTYLPSYLQFMLHKPDEVENITSNRDQWTPLNTGEFVSANNQNQAYVKVRCWKNPINPQSNQSLFQVMSQITRHYSFIITLANVNQMWIILRISFTSGWIQ